MLTNLYTKSKNLVLSFPIYLPKQWHEEKIFFQILMPIIGLIELVKNPKIKSYLLPLLLMFFLGAFQSLILKDPEGIIRCFQAIALVYFGQFLFQINNKENNERLNKNIFILSIAYLLLEIFFTKHYLKKEMLPGFYLYRFHGVVGESNFSGLLFSLLIFMSLYYRKYLWVVLYSLLLFTTMSRTSLGVTVVGVGGFLFVRKFPKETKWISLLGIVCATLMPLILILIENNCSDAVKVYLSEKTNGRYAIWITHLAIFKSNVLGVGYFNAHDMFQSYANQGSSVILKGMFRLVDAPLFQHNMFIHTISEFGLWGYGLLIWFIFSFAYKIKQNSELLFLFTVFLLGCCSLNVFHEFSFYYFLAFLMKEANPKLI